MTTRADLYQRVQVGRESSPGTAVAATKRLRDLMIEFSPEFANIYFRGDGYKAVTDAVKQHEWAVGQWSSRNLSFNSLAYILAALFGHGSVTQIGTTGGYTWPIQPSETTQDPYDTFTVKKGDDAAALSSAYGSIVSADFSIDENGISGSGAFLGRAIDNAATLDSNPTEIGAQLLSLTGVDWFIDPGYGSVGSTKWTDVLRAAIKIPALRVPAMRQNSSSSSFSDLVDIASEGRQLVITAAANAQTRALYDSLAPLTLYFIQKKIMGPNIGTSADYKWLTNFAVVLETMKPLKAGPQQAIYAFEFTFRIRHASAMGRAIDSTLVNTISAL